MAVGLVSCPLNPLPCVDFRSLGVPPLSQVMELMDTDLLHLVAHAETDAAHRRRLRDSTCNLVLQVGHIGLTGGCQC